MDMTDEQLIDYCELHCTTERALFSEKHINRMLALAGHPEGYVHEVTGWHSLHEAMAELCQLARERLKEGRNHMKPGTLILTRSFEDRSQVRDKPSMRTSWKTKPGHAFVLLHLGTVDHEDKMLDQARRVLGAMGWVQLPDVPGEDCGIEAAFAGRHA